MMTNLSIWLKSTCAVLEWPAVEDWAELVISGHWNCGVSLLKGVYGACSGKGA